MEEKIIEKKEHIDGDIALVASIDAATIKSNLDIVEKHLDELLKKYTNIVVTEDNFTSMKKVRAMLNKRKKEFISAGNELADKAEAPIKEFRLKLKEVAGKFDVPIQQLDGDIKGFEEKSRQEKLDFARQEAERISTELSGDAKYASMVEIKKEFGNVATTMKFIKEDIEAQIREFIRIDEEAERARIAAEEEKARKVKTIETIIALENKTLSVPLSIDNFKRFMGEDELTIIEAIKERADEIRKAEEETKKRAVEEAKRKAEEEAERKAKEAEERAREAERKAREAEERAREAERKAREEAEAKIREAEARKAKEIEAEKSRKAEEEKAKAEAMAKAEAEKQDASESIELTEEPVTEEASQFTVVVYEDMSRADEVIELLTTNGFMAVLSDGTF